MKLLSKNCTFWQKLPAPRRCRRVSEGPRPCYATGDRKACSGDRVCGNQQHATYINCVACFA